MLSLPDFREKQILFIQAEKDIDTKIQFWNDNVRLMKDGKPDNQLSCHKIFAIFIMGDLSITSVLIKNCAKYGIGLFLLKPNFELYAAVTPPSSGNYLLREKQYVATNEHEIAQQLVLNKISNQFALLHEQKKMINKKNLIAEAEKKIMVTTENDQLLGVEGSYTRAFFETYFEELGWRRRLPRAKPDAVNTLMDIGYTFMFNLVDSMLHLYGFDTYKGVYHKLFFQRKSLACDIVEPFRCVIERQILKSYHLKQIDPKDFTKYQGQWQLSYEKQRKYAEIFLFAIMEYKEDLFVYVRDYYYFVMNGNVPMPQFSIDK